MLGLTGKAGDHVVSVAVQALRFVHETVQIQDRLNLGQDATATRSRWCCVTNRHVVVSIDYTVYERSSDNVGLSKHVVIDSTFCKYDIFVFAIFFHLNCNIAIFLDVELLI